MIRPRPIDQHLKGMAALGADIEVRHGIIKMKAGKLRGANIYLDVISVGATINIMLAATRACGKTVIENAAKEPEIVDVANFLNAMGARIRGAGTDVIRITASKSSVRQVILLFRTDRSGHIHGCRSGNGRRCYC